jgi:hypothetical protein
MFTIQTEQLKAVAPFMGKGDIREYLNGVCVDVDRAGNVRLVGSDGHRLAVVRAWSLAEPLAGQQFILDGEAMRDLAKSRADQLDVIPGEGFWLVGDRRVKLVEGRYPDWHRVIPDLDDLGEPEPATFNPALLRAFADVSKVLTGKVHNVDVFQRGQRGGSVVTISGRDDFLGILMPMRSSATYAPSRAVFGWVMA